MAEAGSIIPGIGIIVTCPECSGAGWVMHESASGVRQACPRCNGIRTLLDDGADMHEQRERSVK